MPSEKSSQDPGVRRVEIRCPVCDTVTRELPISVDARPPVYHDHQGTPACIRALGDRLTRLEQRGVQSKKPSRRRGRSGMGQPSEESPRAPVPPPSSEGAFNEQQTNHNPEKKR